MPTGIGAIIAGSVLGAGGSVAGSLINKGAQEDATNAQIQANRESIAAQQAAAAQQDALLREFYNQSRSDLAPFRDAQLKATQDLQGLTDPNNPLYSQERTLQTQNIQRQLASQGLLRSKSQSDLLSNLEVGMSGERSNRLGQLAGNGAGQAYAGLATNLGTNLAGVYGNLGQAMGSSFNNLGQIIGQGALNQAGAINQGISGFINSINGGISNGIGYQNQQNQMNLLQGILAKQGGGTGGGGFSVPSVSQAGFSGFGGFGR